MGQEKDEGWDMVYLENEKLKVAIQEKGAELTSEIEVKVVLNLNTLLVTQWEENIIQEIQTKEPDQKKLEEMPGIVCYVVQPQDTLWDIAKMFYTTMDDIRKLNDLGEGEVKPRQTLLVVKNSEG